MLEHPIWGEIKPIRYQARPKKVWKHLYEEAERWDTFLDVTVSALRKEFLDYGGPDKEAVFDLIPEELEQVAYELIQLHNDRFYQPIYLIELQNKYTLWGVQRRDEHRLFCSTPKGILIVIGLRKPITILTAYRPSLPLRNVLGNDRDYAREAYYRWQRTIKETVDAMKLEQTRLSQSLREDSEAPLENEMDYWRFARAIALSKSHPWGVQMNWLDDALQRFQKEQPKAKQILKDRLRFQEGLDRFARSLMDDDLEQIQDGLLMLEELFLVGELLHFEQQVSEALSSLKALVAWSAGGLLPLAAFVGDRLEVCSGAAGEMWEQIFIQLFAPALQPQQTPTFQSNGPLVDKLLSPIPSTVARWLERLEKFSSPLEPFFNHLFITPAPAMLGHSVGTEHIVKVEGAIDEERQLSLFIVDQEHPEGLDVSEDVKRFKNIWKFDAWRFTEPDEQALMIAIVTTQVYQGSLDEQLSRAQEDEEARVYDSWLTTPSSQMPDAKD